MPPRTHLHCTFPGCTKPYLARGYCNTHYLRWKTHGDPGVTKLPRVSLSDPDGVKAMLLSRRNVTPSGCWEWTMYCGDKMGYGNVMVARKFYLVHRLSAAMFLGFDLESDLQV